MKDREQDMLLKLRLYEYLFMIKRLYLSTDTRFVYTKMRENGRKCIQYENAHQSGDLPKCSCVHFRVN